MYLCLTTVCNAKVLMMMMMMMMIILPPVPVNKHHVMMVTQLFNPLCHLELQLASNVLPRLISNIRLLEHLREQCLLFGLKGKL